MKKFKKLLAVILSMVLLISAMPMVSTGALEILPRIELNTPTDVVVTKTSGELYAFEPEYDGYYKFYSTGDCDPYASLFDNYWGEIDYSDDVSMDSYNFCIVARLTAGYTYYLQVSAYLDSIESAQFQICVEETVGVESVEITQEPYNPTCVEGYEYMTIDCSGLEAVFTLSDGSTVEWSYDEDNMVGDFYVDYYIYYDEDDNYFVEIICGNAYEVFYFTTVENPVESIEYSCDTEIECYVNSGGYEDYDGSYIYYYQIPDEAMITVNFKDGTSAVTDINGEIDGVYVDVYDDQYENPWDVGEHYTTLSYLGVETQVRVTILPCPFKSVTVNSAPTKEYIYGDYSSGYLDDEGVYSFWPIELTGLSFTVEYEDGTTQTYDDDDIDMDMWEIDGYSYEIYVLETTGTGTLEATMIYKGAEIKFDVNVIETHVESIEVLTPPDKAEYSNDYYADYTGAVVRLNYKDGTYKEVTVDDSNMYFLHEGLFVTLIEVGDDVINIFNEYDYETGYVYDYFTCAGVGMVYDGVTYSEGLEASSITAENVTMSGEGMILNVEYADGSTEKLTLEPVAYYGESEYYTDGYARTENGILNFCVEKWTDDNGELLGYDVYALGCNYFVEVEQNTDKLLGDVDGDGDISIMDATAIQLHIAKVSELTDDELSRADTDKDGEISILDATAIQLYIAKLITEF